MACYIGVPLHHKHNTKNDGVSLHLSKEIEHRKTRMTHLFGLVATPHVLSDVLDTLDGLFDLRWDHRKGHYRVDALWTQLTCYLPHIWCFWGLLPMLAGARAFLPSTALHRRELTVPELQTVEGASSDLLGITTTDQVSHSALSQVQSFGIIISYKHLDLWDTSIGVTLIRWYQGDTCFFPVVWGEEHL